MSAARARRWKLLPFRSKPPPPPTLSVPGKEKQEDVPREFLCPILGTPMADPVILSSGRTYERACVRACAELSVSLSGVEGEPPSPAIPNDALRAAIRTWRARSGRSAPPAAPSAAVAREAVLRMVPTPPRPPGRSSSNLSCSSRASAASTSSSSSSSGSSSEITAIELEIVRAEEVAKEAEEEVGQVAVKAVESGEEWEVEDAMAALRQATRESAPRRRALCVPRLLAALRRVLLSARHSDATRADATASLANLCLEPENRVPIVRAGVVPALIEVVGSGAGAGASEACEHAAGALFGLALHEGNRAAIGVLGAVPPLLALFTTGGSVPRARRDAGMALYHLSLPAVNQSKLARVPGAAKNLLSIASDSIEPLPIRRLALMVICNVAACVEGRTALMDAGAVATFSVILLDDPHRSELQEWCVAALYYMSVGSPRFRGLAPLILIAEQAEPGAHKDMARKALRAMLGLGNINGGGLHDFSNSERNDDDSGTMASSVPVRRRRAASWGAPPASNSKPTNSHHWRSVCID